MAVPVAGQALSGEGQETTQLPDAHMVPDGHTLPHEPQLRGSLCLFVHRPPASPALQKSGAAAGQAQLAVVAPAAIAQTWPAGQAIPQPPQFDTSFVRSAQ